ncbi:eCIS core domain-containing protein [Aquimarina sp. M1]
MRLQQKKKPRTQSQGEQSFIQPKLKVGQPGDKYEVEADTMADKVVNKTSSNSEGAIQKKGASEEEVQQKPLASSITPLVQTSLFKDRKEGAVQKMEEEELVQAQEEKETESVQKQEEEEPVQAQEEEEPVQTMEEEEPVQKQEEEEPVQAMEEEEPIQAKCDECENDREVQKMEEEGIQTKSKKTNSSVSIESKLNNNSGGNKLSGNTKNEMESGFGADFSQVNIHTDSKAVQMSQELGAQAFTHGNDIYFNKGKYNPSSKDGKHLLAHELTHTIQQKGMVQQKNINKKRNPAIQLKKKPKCVRPIKWKHKNARKHGANAIRIDINWKSSTGTLADLSNCTVREVVKYGKIPNPPFTWTPPNPTILSVAGTSGAAMDTHSYPPGIAALSKKYGNMTATQVYQWKCTGPNCDSKWHTFPGQRYTIRRTVYRIKGTNKWFYRIQKYGGWGFRYSRRVRMP